MRPFFAVVSAMFGTLIATSLVVAIYGDAGTDPLGKGADMAGAVLRDGVIAAVRVSPLIVGASISWVLLVRRGGRPATSAERADQRGEDADPADQLARADALAHGDAS